MAEMVECLPSKHEAFGLNTTKPSTQKKDQLYSSKHKWNIVGLMCIFSDIFLFIELIVFTKVWFYGVFLKNQNEFYL
jgi:hypothetical protein